MLSAPENPAFFETLMSKSVLRYETSPVFINYEEQKLRNFQNSHTDVRFQHHNITLDQTGVTITQDVVSLREDSPQILDTQITVIQQTCETIDTSSSETPGDLETDLEVNARHDENVISLQVDNSFDSHDAGTLPYVSESDKKILWIHRLNLRQDMINTFKNVNELDHIQSEIIDARCHKKDGRGLGTEGDLHALFWSEIADSLCVGTSERGPFVRHDLYKKEWESLAEFYEEGLLKPAISPPSYQKPL